ncbi:MAG TPA: methyltransferase domain-containing protein [Candidatus Acidoferrales bacterium]|nr:methyltransferase domain-containing protein [Candidatus Acidoferrales bacterium]
MSGEYDDLKTSYDRIAASYAEHFAGELDHKPLDRALLHLLAEEAPHGSIVADVGCGPGHVARFLHDRGVQTVGIDISPGMVETARRLNPEMTFREGSLLDLGVEDATWGGIVAFYSIIHLPAGSLPDAMQECARALRANGLLLLAFHVGDEVLHRDEMWGVPVSLDFHLLTMERVAGACAGAGLTVEMTLERRPYTAVEGPTTRGYLLASKP